MLGTIIFIVLLLVCGYLWFSESDWTRWIK